MGRVGKKKVKPFFVEPFIYGTYFIDLKFCSLNDLLIKKLSNSGKIIHTS